jgi:hypothetical protein
VAELRWPTVALDVEKNGQARTPPGPNARASRAAATWNSTMKMHVTHLQDAKASTGSPFDMKVTDRKFSREFNNHWDDLVIAQFEFVNFVFDCLEKNIQPAGGRKFIACLAILRTSFAAAKLMHQGFVTLLDLIKIIVSETFLECFSFTKACRSLNVGKKYS